MAYAINSAKDSRGDEHLFMDRFTQNRAAIEAYRRQHGGDLEGAYRAVTGEAWPEGRSVKMSNGRPEMTKDRTFKSVMGKYVAPIGAGALTALTMGGAAPALAGLFGGGGAAGGAGAAAGAAGAGAAGAGGAGLGLLSGGVLPLGTGLGGAAAAGGASAGGIGGILGGIGSAIKADPLGALGKIGGGISGAASGMAEGRRDDAYAQAAAGRVNQDAMGMDQKRAVLSSLLGGVQDASISRPAGSTIPTFGVSGGLRPSALSGKDALMAELGRKAPTINPAVAGKAENIMGGIGTGLGILGSFKPKVQMPVGYGGPL
jgi:hypothetical protein